MAEFAYQDSEAWSSTIKLAAAVGRLRIGSNLKAAADAQQHAFEQAGLACAFIAEGAMRDGASQAAMYRDARAALARCRSWIHVLAAVTNEPDSLFGNELDLAEAGSRQLNAMLRTIDRGPAPAPGSRGPVPSSRPGPQPPRGGTASGPRFPGPGRGRDS